MKDSIKVFLGFGIGAALVLVLIIARSYVNRTIPNQGDVRGNTGSNLYNNGIICARDDLLYFANPDDGFRLYVSDRNGENLKKLSDDVASFINVDENYVYYTRNNASDDSQFSFLHIDTNSLCRIKRTGGKVKILDHDPDLYASVVGNYIYFLHYNQAEATTLYRTGIDGKGTEQVDKAALYAVESNGSSLYYSGVSTDFYIYRLHAETKTRALVAPVDSYHVVVENGYAYYMDPMHNYRLMRINLADQSTEMLVSDRVDTFLVDGTTLIYQKNSKTEPALMRLTIGTEAAPEKIADGNFHTLNSAYGMVYFMSFDDDTTVYRTSLSPGGTVSVFHPGK